MARRPRADAPPGDGAGDTLSEADLAALAQLRRRIDAIDDQLHDLLMQRAEVVEAVGRLKRSGTVAALRPGREAQILRRLAARHRGAFPRGALLRMWRELLSGMVAMQDDFTIAVQVIDEAHGFWDLARDHYGSQTPILAYRVAGEVVSAVAEGRATLGVLPLPQEDPRDLWWRSLAVGGRARPRIIARLPFIGATNARAGGAGAVVVSLVDPEPSGDDCALLALETNAEVSRGRLVAALVGAGLAVTPLAMVSGTGWDAHLVEIDNLLTIEDPRLVAALTALGEAAPRVSLLGFYARPLAAAGPDGQQR